jgi:hypothetical protein
MPFVSEEKSRNFHYLSSVQKTGVSLTGPDPEHRVGDQGIRS